MSTIVNRWRWWVVAFLLCSILFVIANSLKQGEKTAANNVITVAIASAPLNLNPKFATDAASVRLLQLTSFGLVKVNDDGKISSTIAEIAMVSPQQFKFKLKPELRFSDGSPLTTTFVKSFYDDILNPKTASPLRAGLQDIKNITATANEITFNLSKPNLLFLSTLEIPLIKMVNGLPVGLGAYQITAHDDYGNVTLNALNGAPNLSFKLVKDPTVRLLKLLKGEVDLAYNDLPIEIFKHGINKGLHGLTAPAASYTYIGFNLQNGTASDLTVRQAMLHAINSDEIIATLLGGYASAADSLLGSHEAAFAMPKIEFNPTKAKQILGGKQVILRMNVTTNPFILRVAQALQSQLAEVGIDLQISSSEWGTFYGNIKKGNFESFILTWVGVFQPDILVNLFHSKNTPPNGANRGFYNSAAMDKILDNMMTATSLGEMNSLAKQAQAQQYDDLIYIPLWKKHHMMLNRTEVTGCKLVLDGGYSGLTHCRKN